MATDPPAWWALGNGRRLALDRSRLMAIINATPDSFSDGGRYRDASHAADEALRMLSQGADMLDIGGESTRPGATPVPHDEQIRRVVPVIRALRARGVVAPVSVDTTSAAVALAALDEGADAVNDQSAGRDDPGMFPAVAGRGAGMVLMHRLRRMGEDSFSHRYGESGQASAPRYEGGVVGDVRAFLWERLRAARDAGIGEDRIALDPGLGFGKTVEQNLALVASTREFVTIGRPLVCAASRKSFLGKVLGEDDPARRDDASVTVAVAMRLGGATIFRVHEIAGHRRALDLTDALVVARRASPGLPGPPDCL